MVVAKGIGKGSSSIPMFTLDEADNNNSDANSDIQYFNDLFTSHRGRPAERLPYRVGAQQSAAVTRERAGHVEVPHGILRVAGGEVHRHAGAGDAHVALEIGEIRVRSALAPASFCAALPSRGARLSGTPRASVVDRRHFHSRRGRERRRGLGPAAVPALFHSVPSDGKVGGSRS